LSAERLETVLLLRLYARRGGTVLSFHSSESSFVELLKLERSIMILSMQADQVLYITSDTLKQGTEPWELLGSHS